MSEDKNNIENTNPKSDADDKNKGTESLSKPISSSTLEKMNSLDIGTDFLKQSSTPSYNSVADPNINKNQSEKNRDQENKNLISSQNNPTGLASNSPYSAYYTSPDNYPNQNQNYNYYNQASIQGHPGYQQNYASSAVNYPTQNYPQQYLQGYYNYPYGVQNAAIPQQNPVLNTNYAIPNVNDNLIRSSQTNLNASYGAGQSTAYYQYPQGNVLNQPQAPNNYPTQMQAQFQNQPQYPMQTQVQAPISYQIPSTYSNPNPIMNQPQDTTNVNYQSENSTGETAGEKLSNISNENSIPIQSQNPNLALQAVNQSPFPPQNFPQQSQPNLNQSQIYTQNSPLPTGQAPLYYNQAALPAVYQMPVSPEYNQIPPSVASDPESHGHVNPYFKLFYNQLTAFVAAMTAKLLTLNIHILESKHSIEHMQYPENYRKILRNFSSLKAISSVIPLSLTMVFFDYFRKITDFFFRYDMKNINEQYLSGKIDRELERQVYNRNFIASFSMGYFLSKPLNLLDSIILGISHTLDVRGEKVDEKIIRQNIKDGYYDKFYNKLHNYSVLIYTLKYGTFFGFFNSIKFLKKEYRQNNFFVNFKLSFLLSMTTNLVFYPFEAAREKFAYELIHRNNKQLESSERIKTEPFFKEFKEILKNSSMIVRDNPLKSLGYGMLNRTLPSFFTAFGVAIYENFRY